MFFYQKWDAEFFSLDYFFEKLITITIRITNYAWITFFQKKKARRKKHEKSVFGGYDDSLVGGSVMCKI